jgi:hypothetical protein
VARHPLTLPGYLGWLVIAAACAPPSPPPVLSGHAPPAAPDGPAPTVTWAHYAAVTTGLPAIAGDGSSIIIAHRDNDGGRGNPNLTLIEKDRRDRAVHQLVVLTAAEADDLTPAQLADRFAKATAWLRERHAAEHLVPMTALVTGEPAGDAPAPVIGAGVTLRWAPNQLVIERPHAPPTPKATPASWLAADYPMCSSCSDVCHNEAFLGGGYSDLARSAVIVVIAYRGTDLCWEPSSQEHVITW